MKLIGLNFIQIQIDYKIKKNNESQITQKIKISQKKCSLFINFWMECALFHFKSLFLNSFSL